MCTQREKNILRTLRKDVQTGWGRLRRWVGATALEPFCPSVALKHNVNDNFFFIYLFWEKERKRGRERGGKRESQAGSTLSAQSPTRGWNPWTMRSWPEPKSRVGCLANGATQEPQWQIFITVSGLGWPLQELEIDLLNFPNEKSETWGSSKRLTFSAKE